MKTPMQELIDHLEKWMLDDKHVQFNLTYKPNWFHRTMMRLCFGYKWINL